MNVGRMLKNMDEGAVLVVLCRANLVTPDARNLPDRFSGIPSFDLD